LLESLEFEEELEELELDEEVELEVLEDELDELLELEEGLVVLGEVDPIRNPHMLVFKQGLVEHFCIHKSQILYLQILGEQ